MTYKKTWLSYVLWALYTCVTGIMLADYAILFWKRYINSNSRMFMIGFTFIICAFAVGLYFLIKMTLSRIVEKLRANAHSALMLETFAVLSIFTMALLYRIYLYIQSEGIFETPFYPMAEVKEGKVVEPLVHGASHLYVQFLSFIFSFLGNKVMAAVWVQILIEMLTLLLAYFLVKKMLGRIPACMVMFILAVSTIYNSQVYMLTPEVFFFLLYLIGMFIAGSYVKAYCNNRLNIPMALIGAVFSGIIIGVLAYLDAISLTLLIILAGVITGVDTKENRRKLTPFLLFMLSAEACVLSIAGTLSLDAYISGDGIERVSRAWIGLYTKQLRVNDIIYQYDFFMIECLIQMIVAAFLIIAFWNRQKVQNSSPWICLMLFVAPAPLPGVAIFNYQVYYVFIWSVLAGIGLQQSLVVGHNEELRYSAAEQGDGKQSDTIKHGDEQQSDTLEHREEQTPCIAQPENCQPYHTAELKNNLQDKTLNTAAAPSKPRFIENPLPLPKKHEKREIDYKYDVTEEKMKFDIEVDDNDDFDKQ